LRIGERGLLQSLIDPVPATTEFPFRVARELGEVAYVLKGGSGVSGTGSGAILVAKDTRQLLATVMVPTAITLHQAAEWGAAIAGVATVGLLIAAYWAGRTAKRQVESAASGIKEQIDLQRQINRRSRVYELLAPFYDRRFLEMSAEADELFRIFRKDATRGESKWRSMSGPEKARVEAVLNFYEEVASEHNADFLDKDAAAPALTYVTLTMYERAHGFVEWLRRRNPTYYEQWKYLYEAKRGRSGLPSVPAGWYPDSTGQARLRYWDGHAWTSHRTN
jgi:hypothetical protein